VGADGRPITAEQVEEVGEHLLKRTYSEPHWSARAGSVMATRREPVRRADRRPPAGGYGSVDRAEARASSSGAAWSRVSGDPAPLLRRQPGVRAEVEALEERTRRRDLMVDDEAVWRSTTRGSPRHHLDATSTPGGRRPGTRLPICYPDLADLTVSRPNDPRTIRRPGCDGHELAWTTSSIRAVSMTGHRQSPLSMLNQLDRRPFSWQVPGCGSNWRPS
jgi:ATP-dependent helicase HrpA